MATGSGLSAQVGLGEESTVGTAVTPDHFPYFDSEGVNFTKNTLLSDQLGNNAQANLAPNRVVSTVTAGGDLTVDHAFNRLGLLWKHALGAVAGPTVVVSGAYKSIFTPADLTGRGLTYQKGVPQTDGTVRPFTFNGGKIASMEFSVSTGQVAQLKPTFDFWNVATATALAAGSYPAVAGVFNFSQATIKLGGTVTTTTGVTSVSGGVNLTTLVNSFSFTVTNPLKVDRYGLGNSGVKREQIVNAKRTFTGNLGGEFTQRTELWDLFQADTTTALQVTFTGPIITGSTPYVLDIILPAVKFNTGDVSVGGPDVVPLSLDYNAFLDGGGSNPAVQVSLTNTDATL